MFTFKLFAIVQHKCHKIKYKYEPKPNRQILILYKLPVINPPYLYELNAKAFPPPKAIAP